MSESVIINEFIWLHVKSMMEIKKIKNLDSWERVEGEENVLNDPLIMN